MRKKTVILVTFAAWMFLLGCSTAKADHIYELVEVHQVSGRQGICVEGDHYWVSGSTTLAKYDSSWNLIAENTEPFDGYTLEVNHIGDIDVYNNELYLGVEYFMDGIGKNIQVAVYDGDTLKLKRVFPFSSDTGQLECSGIAVDSDSRTVYMTSWIDDESSEYLYMYDLDSGDYKGKMKMQPAPKWIQGIAYFDGSLYVTSDDGNADNDEPDHMYRIDVSENKETGIVNMEKAFDDVIKQGEIEGLTFDKDRNQFLLVYNRGAIIIAGMPSGFYEGYSEEIHEVFVYKMQNNDNTEIKTDNLTKEQALDAVKNYCFASNPDLKEVVDSKEATVYWEVSENTDNEIVVLYRSYTGSETRFYIDPVSGETYITELVPGIIDQEQRTDESFNVKDYLSDNSSVADR